MIWWILWMIPLVVFAGIALTIFIVSLIDSAESSATGSQANVECPLCGQETPARKRLCQHCSAELQ